jgi:hypothetical protein
MEKSVQKIAQRLLVIGFITLWVNSLQAQCTGGTICWHHHAYTGLGRRFLASREVSTIHLYRQLRANFTPFPFCMGGGYASWDTQITVLGQQRRSYGNRATQMTIAGCSPTFGTGHHPFRLAPIACTGHAHTIACRLVAHAAPWLTTPS